MREKVLIAGFGGQGILLAGIVLSNAAMMDQREVSWLPSYGPEMRGGTANCHVNISDKNIGSPIIEIPDSIIVMNKPSLLKFETKVKKGGIMLINSSLAGCEVTRNDVDTYLIPANDMAMELGNNKITNIIMLGAYIKITGIVTLENTVNAIRSVLGTKKPELIGLNINALMKGIEYIGGAYGIKNN